MYNFKVMVGNQIATSQKCVFLNSFELKVSLFLLRFETIWQFPFAGSFSSGAVSLFNLLGSAFCYEYGSVYILLFKGFYPLIDNWRVPSFIFHIISCSTIEIRFMRFLEKAIRNSSFFFGGGVIFLPSMSGNNYSIIKCNI